MALDRTTSQRVSSLDIAVLAKTEGFRAVPEPDLRALIAAGVPRPMTAGERLFRIGDRFHEVVYLIADGRVQIVRPGRSVEQPAPGYLVGLSSYFSGGPYSATATALEDGHLIAIEAPRLRALERARPQLADALIRLLGASLRQRRVWRPVGAGALTDSVRSVMSTPLNACESTTTLAHAVQHMQRAGRGSLLLQDRGDAVITYESLATQLVRPGVDASRDTVAAAGRSIPRIAADAPLWRAQELQLRTGSKYALVEESGAPVGMLSQTDVLRVLVARHAQLAAAVSEAHTVSELRARHQAMVDLAAEFIDSNRLARVAVRSLSEAHLAVQQRCLEITLSELEADGHGGPPAPFALIIMGSGGRREMMLDPDQDNGLILADECANDERARAWFEHFTDRANENLDASGYPLCPGDIMARNPKFHKPLSEWKAQVRRMTERPSEKAARWSNVVFDFDTQLGDTSLTRALREYVNESLVQRPRLLKYMVDDDAQGRAPLNWFNRLVATGESEGKDTVDIKRNGLRMVANAARILSLRGGISACHTSDRIAALTRAGVLSRDFEATVLDAYDQLLGILLAHQIRQRRAGHAPDKAVIPADLSSPERESLRVAMRAVKRLQELLQDEIGGVRL